MTNEQDNKIKNIIDALNDLAEDDTIPKNVTKIVKNTITLLSNSEEEASIRIHKALNELDELAEDVNMQPYTRTQIWNIVSELESI